MSDHEKKYICVDDLQGGGWCVGCVSTAEGWLERATDWRDSDDSWGDWGEPDDRKTWLARWESIIKQGREQELINYIAEMWQIDIEPYDENNKEHKELKDYCERS